MKLLIFTQKVDKNDTVLGFFHKWLEELSKNYESLIVVCLEKGESSLPKNVTIYSLGKEKGYSKLRYIFNFYKYLKVISGSYDRVFVHMNEEYVILGGLYWRVRKIPIYFWRNHPYGSLVTVLSVALSSKVFCTSSQSFTAKFSKTKIMPVGVDTNTFKPVENIVRKKYSVCIVGRVSPIKRIEIGLSALNTLVKNGTQVSLSIIGSAEDKYRGYLESLKSFVSSHGLSNTVSFSDSVPQEKLPQVYSCFEICLNLTPAGSFDKTIVEASSCGLVPVVTNRSFSGLLPESCISGDSPEEIALTLEKFLTGSEKVKIQKELESFAQKESLSELVKKLQEEIQ